MGFVVNTKQMAEAELRSERRGVSRVRLMQNAAAGCMGYLKERLGRVDEYSFVLLCGSGNNGGDGVELAFLLRESGAAVTVVYTDKIPDTETARACMRRHSSELDSLFAAQNTGAALKAMENADVMVDCVFGTGYHGELPPAAAELFDHAAGCKGFKLSMDIPSGINGSSGVIAAHSFKPDVTLVLGAVKTGLLNYPCSDFCGERAVIDIGIGEDCYVEYEGRLTDDGIYEMLPERKRGANKGSFGKLLNAAGGESYMGAALLSSKAALRVGTGLTTLASVSEVVRAAAAAVPECVFLKLPTAADGFISAEAVKPLEAAAENVTAITAGCGMGNRKETAEIICALLKAGKCPIVLDADGINSVSGNINVLKDNDRPIILTPHPGEFSRLTGYSAAQIQADRLNKAKSFASETGTVVLLKGADTVIASPDGKAFINTSGNNALAKAGCGDVLTGIIGGLAAQGTDPFYSAVLGAYIHGRAADNLVRRTAAAAVLAGDIVEELGSVLHAHGAL